MCFYANDLAKVKVGNLKYVLRRPYRALYFFLSFKALPFIVTDSGKVQEIAAKNTFF